MSELNASCSCYTDSKSTFAFCFRSVFFFFLFVINICLMRYIFILMGNLTVDSISFYLGGGIQSVGVWTLNSLFYSC